MRQILLVNFGFFGIQYSFGIQQTVISPIYKMLGVDEPEPPVLNTAGPIADPLIQSLIGTMLDKTWSEKWGRREPLFIVGAIDCSVCLSFFPFVSALWTVALLLWLLDASDNTAMEPYRAFIADRLLPSQTAKGPPTQSFFASLGIILANASMFLFEHTQDRAADSDLSYYVFGTFMLGSVCFITIVLVSILPTDGIPPSSEELTQLRSEKGRERFDALKDTGNAIVEMPKELRRLGLVYLFQWYTMSIYWQFVSLSIVKSAFNITDAQSQVYREATTWISLVNGSYNVVALMVAFGLASLAKKHSAKWVHTASPICALISPLVLPRITNKFPVFLPMIDLGILQVSPSGVSYIMAVRMVPSSRYGVYMGTLNMMIVLPRLLKTTTFGFVYNTFLGKDPTDAITFMGVLMGLATIAMTWTNEPPAIRGMDDVSAPPKMAGSFKESK